MNVDAVLLAGFAGHPRRAKVVVDLGAGAGAVGLCLLYRDRASRVLLVERDSTLSALSRENLDANGFRERGEALCADVTHAASLPLAVADLVVCNPPYVPPGKGRAPKVAARARVGDVGDFIAAARHVIGARGRGCFVYPAPSLAALLDALQQRGLEPKRLRFVHASAAQPARIALVEATPGKAGGLRVEPPLFERDGDGASRELATLLAR